MLGGKSPCANIRRSTFWLKPCSLYGKSRVVGGRPCDGIPAAGRAVAYARHTHTAQWLLALFYFSTQQSNLIQHRIVFDSRGPLSIHLRSMRRGAILGKTTDYDKEHACFRLARVLRNLRLARIIHDCRREAFENVCRESSGHIVLVRVIQLRPKAFGRENGQRTHQ